MSEPRKALCFQCSLGFLRFAIKSVWQRYIEALNGEFQIELNRCLPGALFQKKQEGPYIYRDIKISLAWQSELLPVKRTVKKYKVFPASSHELLAAFYAARDSWRFSIGVNTPRLYCTRLVL